MSTAIMISVNICTVCKILLGVGRKAKRCSKCQTGCYCSKKCQLEHWPVHKAGCHQMHADTVRLVQRARREMRETIDSNGPYVFSVASGLYWNWLPKGCIPTVYRLSKEPDLYHIALGSIELLSKDPGWDTSRITVDPVTYNGFTWTTVAWIGSDGANAYANLPFPTSGEMMECIERMSDAYQATSSHQWVVDGCGNLDYDTTLEAVKVANEHFNN